MPKAAMAITAAAIARMPMRGSEETSDSLASTGAAVLSDGAGAAAALAEEIFTVACGAGRACGATATLEVPFFEGVPEGGFRAEGPATASLGAAGLGAVEPEAEGAAGLGGALKPEGVAGFKADGAGACGGAMVAEGGLGAEGVGALGALGADGRGAPDAGMAEGLGGLGAATAAGAEGEGGFGAPMAGAATAGVGWNGTCVGGRGAEAGAEGVRG